MHRLDFDTIHILLAEDDPDDCMLFQQAIIDSKITSTIYVAENGLQLANEISEEKSTLPNIIFLDINMPLKNGVECLQLIRSNSGFNNVPVIMYSTSNNAKEIEACYETGANFYVIKPYTYNAIREMIADLCTRDWSHHIPVHRNNFVVSYNA
jgi:CheY-like chemotaxis protein